MIDVLHVIPLNLGRHGETGLRSNLLRDMVEGARQELNRLTAILHQSACPTTYSVRVREGLAYDVILREARATNASLIVMGFRPRIWLSGWRRRQTVRRVLAGAPCPVMVVTAIK